jgi:integrase
MKLQELIQEYQENRETLGWRRCPSGGRLGAFGRFIGAESNLADIKPDLVIAFLKGEGEVTLSWHLKYGDLKSFYRWLFERGYVDSSPLPKVIPKLPPSFVPYIYSTEELKRILQAFDTVCRSSYLFDAATAKMMVLTLYGCGLRRQEAINLNSSDVDFEKSVLTIRDTKFHKTRFVPFGEKLGEKLKGYAGSEPEDAFFVDKKGARVDRQLIQRYFRFACDHAGVRRTDGKRFQPRLHDLRHSFAVHRLTSWYESGADVQHLLPYLSTYLGHVCIKSTQTYLTITPALLDEANQRFESYSQGGEK